MELKTKHVQYRVTRDEAIEEARHLQLSAVELGGEAGKMFTDAARELRRWHKTGLRRNGTRTNFFNIDVKASTRSDGLVDVHLKCG